MVRQAPGELHFFRIIVFRDNCARLGTALPRATGQLWAGRRMRANVYKLVLPPMADRRTQVSTMMDLELKTLEHEHVEGDIKDGVEPHVQLRKSRLDELSIPRTLWVFRRAVFYTFCVYTGFLCEGFEVRMAQSRWQVLRLILQLNAGSSVVANAGFVKQFGAQDSADVRTLDPTWREYIKSWPVSLMAQCPLGVQCSMLANYSRSHTLLGTLKRLETARPY